MIYCFKSAVGIFLTAFLMLCSTQASAYFYRVDAYSPSTGLLKHVSGSDASALCGDYVSQRGASGWGASGATSISPNSPASGFLCTPTFAGPPSNSYTLSYYTPSTVACTATSTQYAMPKDPATMGCVTTCPTAAGTKKFFSGSGDEAPLSMCAQDNCKYDITMGFGSPEANANHPAHSWTAYGTSLGTYCDGTVSGTPNNATDPKGFFQSATVTAQFKEGQTCGLFNGESTCLGAVPNGSCVKTAGGNSVCSVAPGAALASPPAPNNGTAGTAAAPGMNITGSASPGTKTSLYAAGSTGSSTTTPTNGSAAGTSSGSGSTVGTAANPSVTDCQASHTCTDGTFAAPSGSYNFADLTGELSAAKQAYQDAVTHIQDEASGLYSSMSTGGGQLPRFQADIHGAHIDFDFTQYAAQISMIGTAILFLAVVVAAYIILR